MQTVVATGPYSDLIVLWAVSQPNDKFQMHFGLVLAQKGSWKQTATRTGQPSEVVTEGKYLLMDHLGDRLRVKVYSNWQEVKNAMQVFGSAQMSVREFEAGRSNARVDRFLGSEVFKQHLLWEYSSAYTSGEGPFFDWNTSNCLRFTLDALLMLKVPKEVVHDIVIGGDGANDACQMKVFKMLLDKLSRDDMELLFKVHDGVEKEALCHPKVKSKFLPQLEKQCKWISMKAIFRSPLGSLTLSALGA